MDWLGPTDVVTFTPSHLECNKAKPSTKGRVAKGCIHSFCEVEGSKVKIEPKALYIHERGALAP